MTMTSITVRIDEETKAEATKIVEDFGFDIPSITRAFYKQIVREKRIPINLSYDVVQQGASASATPLELSNREREIYEVLEKVGGFGALHG